MSLEYRRRRGDLIQMNKLVNGHEDINLLNGINFAKSSTINLRRQHKSRLVREINKNGSCRYNFITNRVISSWNDLPESAVSATSTNSFKNIIDEKVFGMTRSKWCQSRSSINEKLREENQGSHAPPTHNKRNTQTLATPFLDSWRRHWCELRLSFFFFLEDKKT